MSQSAVNSLVDYDIDVGSHIFHSELGYLASILRATGPSNTPLFASELAAILTSLVTHPSFDYFSLNDTNRSSETP